VSGRSDGWFGAALGAFPGAFLGDGTKRWRNKAPLRTSFHWPPRPAWTARPGRWRRRGAVNQGAFDAATWKYGNAFSPPPGAKYLESRQDQADDGGRHSWSAERWSSGIDPSTYCAMANAGYDFIWTEMQHANTTWDQAGKAWRTCPNAKSGFRGRACLMPTNSRSSMRSMPGALVIVVPTIDTVEEATAGQGLDLLSPLGKRSLGGGAAFDPNMWGSVPGRLPQTRSPTNVVLILMIETLEGPQERRRDRQGPGRPRHLCPPAAILAISPDTSRATRITSARSTSSTMPPSRPASSCAAPGRGVSGPDFTCFQAGNEMAAIARGVKIELGEHADTQGRPEIGPFATARSR